ncbi:pentatricopeptide repeat-containing protein At2g20710, mitochondrial-like [Populus nigra]|uniref:pentatricopeptide repeat-containing protein At2g20710, mitochondrial-like n=1 Tax=Populus nigra TaxID=3691 RepID=UPI002B26EDAC|nr:pentatricopeptide repeat-containing protein At2g20710, mitochondrial-like [Populus nigra]
MEKVPMNMERDRRINWKVCLAVAKGHLKADFTEKALTILKHSEQLSRNSAGFYNSGYLHITSSLMKSDDFDGAEEARGIREKDCREWELGAYSFDLLATGYSGGDLMVKATERIKKAIWAWFVNVANHAVGCGIIRRAFQADVLAGDIYGLKVSLITRRRQNISCFSYFRGSSILGIAISLDPTA